MTGFDREVAEIRKKGVEPKPFYGRKRDCTDPTMWAANLEYYAKYSARSERYRHLHKERINRRAQQRNAQKSDEERSKQRAYYKLYNDDPVNKRRRRGMEMFRAYGLSDEQYMAALAGACGRCAICGEPCRSGRRLSIDHDHATGAYRGLLCDRHNRGLGYFQDSPELLRKAAAYLEASGDPSFCIVTYAKLMEERHGNN
jgi:hypothetical protein